MKPVAARRTALTIAKYRYRWSSKMLARLRCLRNGKAITESRPSGNNWVEMLIKTPGCSPPSICSNKSSRTISRSKFSPLGSSVPASNARFAPIPNAASQKHVVINRDEVCGSRIAAGVVAVLELKRWYPKAKAAKERAINKSTVKVPETSKRTSTVERICTHRTTDHTRKNKKIGDRLSPERLCAMSNTKDTKQDTRYISWSHSSGEGELV